jgi:hypothetical protein
LAKEASEVAIQANAILNYYSFLLFNKKSQNNREKKMSMDCE